MEPPRFPRGGSLSTTLSSSPGQAVAITAPPASARSRPRCPAGSASPPSGASGSSPDAERRPRRSAARPERTPAHAPSRSPPWETDARIWWPHRPSGRCPPPPPPSAPRGPAGPAPAAAPAPGNVAPSHPMLAPAAPGEGPASTPCRRRRRGTRKDRLRFFALLLQRGLGAYPRSPSRRRLDGEGAAGERYALPHAQNAQSAHYVGIGENLRWLKAPSIVLHDKSEDRTVAAERDGNGAGLGVDRYIVYRLLGHAVQARLD